MDVNEDGVVVGVNDSQPLFLKYLDKMGISLGSRIKVIDRIPYDNSIEVVLENEKNLLLSSEVTKNIFLSV